MLRFGVALLATIAGMASRPTLAQAAETADELYRRGVTEFRAGHYQAACRALAQSHQQEALPGVLFTLATCESRAGRPATAIAHYDEFLKIVANSSETQRASQEERRQVAVVERERALATVARLEVEFAEAPPAGSQIMLDGEPQDTSTLSRALLLNPGAHTLSLRLVDGRKEEQRFVLAEGERRRARLSAPEATSHARGLESEPPGRSRTSPWLYVAGASAGAGLTTGVVTGLLAMERKNAVNDNCRGAACNQAGKVAADTARSEALASTIAFGVAGASVAVFLAIWLWEPSESKAPKHGARAGVELGVTPSGALLRGHF